MKKFTLYIESSIFGFYDDDKPYNQSKKDAVRKLFDQIKNGLFEAITSPVTIKEISAAPKPYREQLLELVKSYSISVVDVQQEELESLLVSYMEDRVVPSDFEDDARHFACATLLKVDYLITYNLTHIANEKSSRKFNSVNIREGYSPVTVKLPEEVIDYGN